MSGVSILRVGEKKGPLWKLRKLSFPGEERDAFGDIRESRRACFAAR